MVYFFANALFTYVCTTSGLSRVSGNRGDYLNTMDA
jgi:hypothetical protein